MKAIYDNKFWGAYFTGGRLLLTRKHEGVSILVKSPTFKKVKLI